MTDIQAYKVAREQSVAEEVYGMTLEILRARVNELNVERQHGSGLTEEKHRFWEIATERLRRVALGYE
jgi:hypothetical protein